MTKTLAVVPMGLRTHRSILRPGAGSAMTTVIRVMTPLLFDYRAQTLVVVFAAVATGVLLGPGEAAARPKGPG